MPSARHPAHDRRALAALFAVFALLVQALIPAAAMARPDSSGTVTICTATGTETIAPHGQPAPHKGFGGMPCQDCLAAAMAAVVTPQLAVQPVAYAAERVEHAPVVSLLEPRARAPPRPPGQGPPTA
ncbi:MAG: hypothetical protein JWR47_1629 [Phenylobacterium sp.]|uniref:DUF2946 family protein n=1 Tax=Phenylobacterium sp. TaxID=1871053 RepID=UPI0026266B80|nr:DUF2946 family protein [Phenylobacterium sp.]MDB5435372.1 hypothetical protein [Phenylobacterium sp.]MDB5499937.1 hypothetical protein [Phenylobacterium sp.]